MDFSINPTVRSLRFIFAGFSLVRQADESRKEIAGGVTARKCVTHSREMVQRRGYVIVKTIDTSASQFNGIKGGSAINVLATIAMIAERKREIPTIRRTHRDRNRAASWIAETKEATTTNIREESAKCRGGRGRPRVAVRRVDRSVGLVRRASLRFNHALPHAQPRNSQPSRITVEVLRPGASSFLLTD